MENKIKKLSIATKNLPQDDFCRKLFPILEKRIKDRSNISVQENGDDFDYEIAFAPDETIPNQGFRIESTENGICIFGAEFLSFAYGAGQFLHKSHYEKDAVLPTDWRGESIPDCSMRFVYFATHFYNWYHACSVEELTEHLEDLILWGMNGMIVIVPTINVTGFDDPMLVTIQDTFRKLLRAAKSLNLKTGMHAGTMDFTIPNERIKADKKYLVSKTGNPICTSTEEGYQYARRKCLDNIKIAAEIGLDYLTFWAYDEGGCSCDKCWPWGYRGFYNFAKRLGKEVREFLPDTKFILSTWYFERGEYQKGEWEGFYKRLKEDEANGDHWADYILLETRDDKPLGKYVVEHGQPTDSVKAITFPDPSMTGITPWGGFGAICTPRLMVRQEKPYMQLCDGGYMYTEGIFDDMNKAVMLGLYWSRTRSTDETLTDYCGYEFKGIDPKDLIKLVRLWEDTQDFTNRFDKKPCDVNIAREAWALAQKMNDDADEETKKCWRWRITYIRSYLDMVRYENCEKAGWPFENYKGSMMHRFWGTFVNDDPKSREYLAELIKIYKASEHENPSLFCHNCVRPPLFDLDKPEHQDSDENDGI